MVPGFNTNGGVIGGMSCPLCAASPGIVIVNGGGCGTTVGGWPGILTGATSTR